MNQRGLSLIELMVVIAIFSLLTMAGLSFSTNWSTINRLNAAEHDLYHSYSLAKSQALRNAFAVSGGQAATALCFGNDTMTVHTAQASGPASCDSTPVWSADLGALVTVEANGVAVACLCVSNHGRITQVGAACASCGGGGSLLLRSGGETKNVELL
ncbi:prepilin-type N-terminal cleavage/methylation domain-containing protein [Teredinibacter turnerae]|uniref:prepilin-type N-terminal cleavage/methylation domain-containing protein n=1 Tax=Teredinibacter turnerae TaxID=2426 RepID=UPI00036CFD80|nr:prepilin-type N-terminal cleavage/methylation domain-containing protein [Teredinibacter turnerae]